MSTKKDKFSLKDKFYMEIALMLANSRQGLTGSNPSVGCVIVKNDKIISIGQTSFSGRPHAEFNAIKDCNVNLKEGIYVGVSGPTFETPAEYKMFRILGADVVGMSTVPEVIVARHMDIKVFGISIITDSGVPGEIVEISHEEVQEVAKKAEKIVEDRIRALYVDNLELSNKLLKQEISSNHLLEDLIDAVVVIDLEGNILKINKAAYDLIDMADNNKLAHINDFQSVNSKRLFKFINHLVKTEQSRAVLFPFTSQNGNFKIAKIKASILKSPDGEIADIQTICHDVTEEERLKKLAKENELEAHSVGYADDSKRDIELLKYVEFGFVSSNVDP